MNGATMSNRFGFDVWGPTSPRRLFDDKHWAEPLAWNRQAEKAGRRARVFCGSMCDVFEHNPNYPPAYLGDQRWRLWKLIENTPWLIWMLLTKRPENVLDFLPELWKLPGRWPENVWVGTSVENQEWANRRIPELLKIPAPVLFLSLEPLLGDVDLTRIWMPQEYQPGFAIEGEMGFSFDCLEDNDGQAYQSARKIGWVIVGGESGPKARPMHPDWAYSLRDQCEEAGVPYFFKSWGEWFPRSEWENNPDLELPDDLYCSMKHSDLIHLDDEIMHRVGKRDSGRLLDGQEWNQYPDETEQ